MEKPITVIEISDTQIRLAAGYFKDNKINLIHMSERPITGLISHGEIIDPQTLIQILSSMREFKDETTKEKLSVNEATVIFPALGLQIYESKKTTTVIHKAIDYQDIDNVIHMISKEIIPAGNKIIEIVPDAFILEQGRSFANPPINEVSDTLTINAKIHTLPISIVNSYVSIFEKAHIQILKKCVSSYAISELARYNDEIPTSYFLLDMGAENSSVSLIGQQTPFETITFSKGGNDLIKRISENFRVSMDVALEILKEYGFDERPRSYSPTICKSVDEDGEKSYDQDNLNSIIKEFFFEEYFNQFDVSFSNLIKTYSSEQVKRLPIVFTGGLSKMFGFDIIAKQKFSSHQSIHYLEPTSYGARDARFSAIIGGMYVDSRYKGALSEVQDKENPLSRDNK